MNTSSTSFRYIETFIHSLVKAGVSHICFSPGSRSTPLTVTAARHPSLTVWTQIDERSSGYFALGMARALGAPVALVCTSGSAAANYMPAVVEAHYTGVPLIVLTADRPHEARGMGSPQTIDQIKMYGSYVKWFSEMAPPEPSETMLRYARVSAAKAVACATSVPEGPVHLNFPLREPLMPPPPGADSPLFADKATAEGANGSDSVAPRAVRLHRPDVGPTGEVIHEIVRHLDACERPLIVCGPYDRPGFPETVIQLAEKIGAPLLADPLSQVRSCGRAGELVIDGYDAFLRAGAVAAGLRPDLVLRLGAIPTSKSLSLYLSAQECRHITVSNRSVWDPLLRVTDFVEAEASTFCRAILCAVEDHPVSPSSADWLHLWKEANRLTQRILAQEVHKIDDLFEGRVFAELRSLLPEGSALFVGNSMPVRDLDTFFPVTHHRLRIFANRGANGIDGVVSSALGVSAAAAGPTVLVIGDLSFYHDLSGLLVTKLHGLKATIVLLNNDGGGIFSFLPQANHPEHFEALFGTPHGLEFESAVTMYGGTYTEVSSWPQFRSAVQKGVSGNGLNVIALKTNRPENAARHRTIWSEVATYVSTAMHGELADELSDEKTSQGGPHS